MRARIFRTLAELRDQGPAAAVARIEETGDEAIADYVAQYLELTPGHAQEKTRAAELLRGKGPMVRSVSRLVPWVPEELLNEFVSDHLADPRADSPVADVLFCIGIHRPALLRPVADRLGDDLQRALLSGAPDILADAFLERWRETGDLGQLEALALIRTSHAADLIASVGEEVGDRSDWDVLAQLSGRLADTGAPAGYRPAYLGYVADPGESGHVLGGRFEGSVPICLSCEAPAERVLALAAADLPFPMANDPAFFWYSCDCEAMDSTTVRIGPSGLTVYFGPDGQANGESTLVPGGERALVLEPHPNQVGVSLETVAGEPIRQVGGLPNWVTIDRHPRCPECGQDMPFVASLGGGSTLYGAFGFEGHLYCFWCDDCQVSSTKMQD